MAMLLPNDLNKDPRQNKHVRSPRARRALGLFSRALFAILSTAAVGQKGPVTVSAGSRTSSNPAVAGWSSFVGKRGVFFSFSFSFGYLWQRIFLGQFPQYGDKK